MVQATLEPGPTDELTPSRLAKFYRTVGGNYDSLFLKSSDHALSFMYKTLGCFHSLQPMQSPFETPRIPCLNPTGFARWQTIQLLLCPEDNVGFIQKAVQLWNVPAPNGGIYPKHIPKDVFPDGPDEAMEKWHKMVTGKLNQQNYNMRRIKNSPYQSPHPEAYERRDGYFAGAQVGRPARPSRSSSRDEDQAALYRRRSSVPDFPSPSGERGSHWDPRTQQEARKARSHSAQRLPPNPRVGNALEPRTSLQATKDRQQVVRRAIDTELLHLNRQDDEHRLGTMWRTAPRHELLRPWKKILAAKGVQRHRKGADAIESLMRIGRLGDPRCGHLHS